MKFDCYIGIDYSGAKTVESRLKVLQVYMAGAGELPKKISPPSQPKSKRWNWSRKEIAEWLISLAGRDARFIAGIDHAFSFPISYLDRFGLPSWDAFLVHMTDVWPTHAKATCVDDIRKRNPPPPTGSPDEFRLTDKWTSSAKSVFRFDVQGQVAKSSHAGIPWLHVIRQAAGRRVRFWPFDGWGCDAGTNVIAEVYPSIFHRRYPSEGRTPDEQDAYSVARWLCEADKNGFLERYFDPPLTPADRLQADREGWILGVL
ncbi:MAG: hypothetical protein C4523_14205 [Myxococcales bacterium]|nr:MAG: hypothetical protein C4523_14205 [Myxococcales bacterium]